MLTLTEALKQMTETLRLAGYPAATIEVNLSRADVDAAQREEVVARAIIAESLHPVMLKNTRHAKPLGVVEGVRIFIESR